LVAYSGKALVEYRVNPKGISKSNSKRHLQAFKDVYEKHLHLLENRNLEEKAQVQVRLDSIVAVRQYKMLASNFDSKYSIDGVFHRNLLFFKKLPKNKRILLIQNNRKVLDKLMKYSIKDNVSKGHLFRAFWFQVMLLNCEFSMPKSISTAIFKILKYIKKNN
jgi:hypothetical protein